MLKRYLLRRLVHVVLLLAGVSLLSFVLLELAPGDFLGEAKLNPQLSPATLAALRDQYGLNKSLPQKYAVWVGSVIKGEFGVSFAYNLPVSTLLWPRTRKTLELSGAALALSWLIALPIGVWSAARRGRRVDRLVTAAISALLGIPEIALVCLLGLLATRARVYHSGNPVLPVAVLVLGAVPVLLRHVRAALLDVANQGFARTARANGIRGRQLWFRCLLPAAANPLVTLFGFSVAGLLSASFIVEVFIGWPGLGPLLLEAIAARDFYLVVAPVVLSAIFLSIGMLLADLLLYALDPRIRIEG